MRVRVLPLFFILSFFFYSCKEDDNAFTTSELVVNEEALTGCWKHSFEEEEDNLELLMYRPCDFKEYPLSRYRHEMELKGNGTASWLHLAENDAHSMRVGTWTYDRNTRVLQIFNLSGKSVSMFRVLEVGENILKLEYIYR